MPNVDIIIKMTSNLAMIFSKQKVRTKDLTDTYYEKVNKYMGAPDEHLSLNRSSRNASLKKIKFP